MRARRLNRTLGVRSPLDIGSKDAQPDRLLTGKIPEVRLSVALRRISLVPVHTFVP